MGAKSIAHRPTAQNREACYDGVPHHVVWFIGPLHLTFSHQEMLPRIESLLSWVPEVLPGRRCDRICAPIV